MRIAHPFSILSFIVITTFPSGGRAGIIDTVDWVNPNPLANRLAGIGTGTLADGSIIVTYSTLRSSDSAMTIQENWDVNLATGSYAKDGVTHNTGGVLAAIRGRRQINTITFSQPISNPVLLVNYAEDFAGFNFGTRPVVLLSSHHANLVGNVITFVGASNSVDDGFAIQIPGVFGPEAPLSFTYGTTTLQPQLPPPVAPIDTVGFSLTGQPVVPEPASLGLMVIGGIALTVWGRCKSCHHVNRRG